MPQRTGSRQKSTAAAHLTFDDLKGYINLSGVRSTGLTLSVAMGVYVADVMREMGAPMVFKENFISTRKGIVRFHELSREEQDEIVKENPEADKHPFYGEWVSGYASESYHEENERLIGMMNRLAADCTPAQEAHLIDIFTACSRYEAAFWDMAWEMRR